MSFPIEARTKLTEYLNTHELSCGVGTKESACSIAAINLAISGKLTDKIPDCMSEVIGRWIINVQDAMPADMRNSKEWKALLPYAAGTGREREAERLALLLDWMWVKALPSIQAVADTYGFGAEWRTMCEGKTQSAAYAARAAADAAAYAAYAAYAARAAADAAADAAAYAARAAADAAAYAAAYAAADAASWQTFNPCELLKQLIEA